MKHLVLLFTLLSFAYAQDYTVTVQYNSTTKTASLVWTMPAADAQYFNARFGTDELEREAQTLVNRIKARIAEERERDAQRAWRWLTKAQQDAALEKERAYRDTVGTFERKNPPTQGALASPDWGPNDCYAEIEGGFLNDVVGTEPMYAGIGKMYVRDLLLDMQPADGIKLDHYSGPDFSSTGWQIAKWVAIFGVVYLTHELIHAIRGR